MQEEILETSYKLVITSNDVEHLRDLLSINSTLSALDTIRENVRRTWKYGEHSDETFEAIDKIYEMICDEIDNIPRRSL